MKPLRILVADDHEIVRQGIRALLETKPGWEVCGEARDGAEAVEMARDLKPEVVILDIGMPKLNGLEATREILKESPKTEILILTMHEAESIVRSVLDAGAKGYLLKSDAGQDLIVAVEFLERHNPFFTSRVSNMLIEGYLKKSEEGERATGPRNQLTPRQREIVRLVAEGRSNKEVATLLHLSVKTVETHRANVMDRLNLRSVSDLVRYAVRNDIIQP